MKRIALVLLVTAGLVAAGCGSNSDDNNYVKQVNKVNASLTTAITKLSVEPSTDPKAVAANIDKLADTIDKSADDLDAIDEPDKAKAGHAKLVQGTHKVAADFRKLAQTAKSNPSGLSAATAQISSSAGVKEIDEGFKELTDAGFKQK